MIIHDKQQLIIAFLKMNQKEAQEKKLKSHINYI